MTVCKFWQQGTCRYGDRCRFDHPPLNQGLSGGNRFAALQGSDGSSARNTTGDAATRTNTYSLDKAAIVTDLSSERPQWILSAYGPGRNAPTQLFGGELREQSFEEMRYMHYMALASGNPQHAAQEADKLFQASEQQIQTVLNNVDGAIDFIINAEKEHPNRIDICQASMSGPLPTSNPLNQSGPLNAAPSTQGQNNPFGAPAQQTTTPAFGAPTQQTTTSAFGAPSSTTQAGAFGQPTALGQKPSAFGGTSQAFGAPSQLGAGGAFGQPSALGQKPNPFGAPSAGASLGTSSSAAPFSSFAGAANPFSQPQQQQAATPFGTPSNPPISSAFQTSSQPAQQNPFGQAPSQNANPFGSANPPAQQNPFGTAPTPFGAPAPTTNPFGQPSTKPPATNVNPFGSAATTGPFAQGAVTQATAPNPFRGAQQATAANIPMDTQPFGGQPQPLVNGTVSVGLGGSSQHPSVDSYSTAIGGRLSMFKGMRVSYKGDEAGFTGRDGSWQKIWFPQGAPPPYKDTEMEESRYNDGIKSSYAHLQQSRSFQGGVMPLIPPRREWCMFDF